MKAQVLIEKGSAQPPTRDPQRTQERILAAALKEFSAHVFAGARVDVIARRAAINKRMLYHYFGDKQGLFRAVLHRKLAERAAWLAAAPEDPMKSLPYWFELASNDLAWIRLLEWEALQMGENQILNEGERRAAFARAVAKIRTGQVKGLLASEFDPRQVLLSMMALTAYPLAFPQLTKLATGLSVTSPEFKKQRVKFLNQFAAAFQSDRGKEASAAPPHAANSSKGKSK